jgi:prephenate dehydrogenase
MTTKIIAIIGLGLIGGSLAKALKLQDADVQITGIDADPEARELLLGSGAVNVAYATISKDAVSNAAIIVIATPPHSWMEIALALSNIALDATLIMDVGSVKAYANQCFGHLPHFVAAHPIAGSEFSGAAFSTEALFTGKRLILTPTDSTNAADVATATNFWNAFGMHISVLEAHTHDRIYAYVSHLPQFTAYALAHATLTHGNASDEYLKFLRLGGSSPDLWTGIFQHNPYLADAAEHLLHIIVHLITELRTGALHADSSTDWQLGQKLLPRLIASTLISCVTMEEKKANLRMASYAGSGFADMTHPAFTPPEADLALISTHTNDVIAVLEATEAALRSFLINVKNADWRDLQSKLNCARTAYVQQLESVVD